MTDLASGDSMRGWRKRIESKVALALSRAQAAFSLADAGHQSITNGAPIGPAGQLEFESNFFVSRHGHVRINVFATVMPGGGTVVAGDRVDLTIQRDSATSVGGASGVILGTAAAGRFSLSYSFDDVVAAGSSHQWNLLVTINNGHTGSLQIGDATIQLLDLAP